MHKVERKETIFSICQEYGITQEDLLALNPELKNGKLKKGMFIFIPYPKSSQPASTEMLDSRLKIKEALAGSTPFCPTICKVYPTPQDITPA